MATRRAANLSSFHIAFLALFAWTSVASAQTTVFSDDFSGGGGALNGAAPDTTTGGATWASGDAILDDGSVAAGRFTALLPFQPQANFIYNLSADLVTNSATPDDNWLGIGFTQLQQANLNDRFIAASEPALWALTRSNMATLTDSSFLGYPGGNHVFGELASPTTSADRIVMTLDTTGLDWVWTVDFGDDGVDRTEAVAVVPNINFVGLTASSDTIAGSTVDNFLLTQLEVPINEWNVDGGGTFGDAGNWTMGVPAAGSTVLFGDILTAPNAPAVVNVNSATSLGQIRFANTQQYSIQGAATLTLTGDASVAPIQGTHLIGARLGGSNGLTKAGAGAVILSNGTNNYTGDTTISTGVLEITDLGAINQASGSVNVAAGAVFRFGGDGEGNGASGTFTEQIAGAGQVRLDPSLTTEVVTASAANAGFTGVVSIGGGTLRLTDGGALGSADGMAATGTVVGGGEETGTLELAGVTVSGERLQINGRQPGITDPALSSTGISNWTGPIAGATGGNQYNIESQSGLLTLSGDITMPDTANDANGRNLNLTGAGNGRIEGQIIDRTVAADDGAENVNINVVKSGAGTWTIATMPPVANTRDAYHQGRTVVEQGTLAVEASAGDSGELYSRTIEVHDGSVFDVSSFGTYSLQILEDPDTAPSTGDEIGQELIGTGNIDVGTGTVAAFDDSSISPGLGVGALSIDGNFSYSTFTELATGSWNYELGNTTDAGDSDRLVVSGSAAINAGDANDAINVSVSAVEGTLAAGTYALVQGGSVSGSAAAGNYVVALRDAQGNDITAGARQTFGVSHSATAVNLNVTGASANLSWAGTAGNAWDVKTTNNWTGAGGPQFSQLDNVTFGNVANKNVTVDTNVAPGSVTFSGGASTTYTVTGAGGMTGFGPVNVNSGTVQLNNAGNAYAGTTTIANGARLEMVSASTGSIVANGTLSVSGSVASTLIDDFNDGNVTEYTTYTVLDQPGTPGTVGPPDDVVYSNTGSAITVNGAQNGNPAPEQAVAMRAANLEVGQTLVVDANLVSNHNIFASVGIAVADENALSDIPAGTANADVRSSYLYTGMRLGEATDGNDNRNFLADGTTVAGTAGGVGAVTNLWITRTSENDYTTGYSQDNMATRVTGFTHNDMNWTPNSVGFYADIRGAIDPNAGTMDNLRIAPGGNNVLEIDGDFTLASTGSLELDLGQDAIDMLAITGAASLDGMIEVGLASGFTPTNGAQYTILTAAGGITDLGVDFDLPENFAASIVDLTSLVLTYAPEISGDFNNDGFVNAADYVLWRDQMSNDPAGYTAWQNNFGATAGAGTLLDGPSGAVPEPASWLLAGLCLLAAFGFRRRGASSAQL